MSKLRGEVGVKQILLLCVAIIGAGLAIFLLFILLSNLIYGPCWSQPKKALMGLKNGDNIVDFRGCVQKVIFVDVSGLTAQDIKSEVNIYDCDEDRNRLKGYGSFIIMIPIEYKAGVGDYLKNPLKAYQRGRMKTTCIWRNYGVFEKAVFEGANEKHCIHMEDYQTTPTAVIKNIDPCVAN